MNFSSGDMPPPLTPPPIIAAPPQKPRKSRGWMIFAIVLIVLLCFSLFGNFVQAISHALNFTSGLNRGFAPRAMREAGPRLDEVLLKDNDSHNKIAVVTVDGIITSHTSDQAGNNMVDVIRAQLDRASDDARVKAVLLKVDSPGGEVMASDQINKLLVKFQNDSKKPVICSMGSLAASGGYYISAPCRWIEADDLTLTASIGVIMEGINYRGLMDKIGIAPNVYKSGKHKDMLSGMRETNEIPADEHEMIQNLIMDTYGQFTNIVAKGRSAAHEINQKEGRALSSDWMSYADGRVVSGKQALKLGLVDQLGDFDDAVKKTKEITKIGNANLIEYRERYDIGDFLSMFGQSSKAHDIKLDLGVEAPKLQAGERYFLWLPPTD
ncbi:MAG TPA: signal peptide peptidase SppA [Methylomirabilota bacterium]|nr:signal peptide peptidase SppA [Methylomirabilota bacterium]